MTSRQNTKVKVHADLQKLRLLVAKKYEPLFGKSLSNPENKEILDALVLDMLLALARTIKTSYPYKFPQTPENIVDAMLFGINKTHKTKEEQEIVKQIFSSIESVEPKDIKRDIENKVYHTYKETHNNEPLRNFLVTIMWITIAVVVLAVIF